MASERVNIILKVIALYAGFVVLGVLFFLFFDAGLDVDLFLK